MYHLFRAVDVAFAERVMGQPTSDDNYRGYDVSRARHVGFVTFNTLICHLFDITCHLDVDRRFD